MAAKITDEDLKEMLYEIGYENPIPEEKWHKRENWDPMFSLALIDRAVSRGYVETRGDRGSDAFALRFTSVGRLAERGVRIATNGSDAYEAIERLKQSSPADGEAISTLVRELALAALVSPASTPVRSNAVLTDLNENLKVALLDVGGYQSGVYWWKQASMKRLAAMGLVEAWHPEGATVKRMAYRLTAHGKTLYDAVRNLGMSQR